jgi:ABC-type nickel/cobalt efflux system permease component RcnA
VGWRELTATADGVRLPTSPLPVSSISAELTSYPKDLLTSAPDVRTATLHTEGAGDASPAAAAGGGIVTAGPDWLMTAQRKVESVVGGHLSPLVIAAAFLLALLLGAGHAALPGHGKTVMAAYFAGRRGSMRDALAVGGTVTLAHTGGVLLVGLLLSTSTALAGERLLAWLGAASGALVVAVGVTMLVAALKSRRRSRAAAQTHAHTTHTHAHATHTHSEPHAHALHDHGPHDHVEAHTHEPSAQDESHAHSGTHSHGHATHTHAHDSETAGHHHHHTHGHHHRPGGRFGLAGIGLAGGLVPSPSALVVLLGAIGLGRAGLGVLLVLAYGIGMAATLTAVGLLLVVAQRKLGDRLSRPFARFSARVAAGAPTATAALVVLVGLGMGARAIG